MSADLARYLALQQVEIGLAAGFDVPWAVSSAAESFTVPSAELALLALQKHVACSRARAAVQSMAACDEAIEDVHAPSPRSHRVNANMRGRVVKHDEDER